jgi:mono/diheme cytochrome c family protein
MSSLKRLIVAIAALALAGSLVTACSKSDSSSANTAADATATAAATTAGPVTDSADSGMKSTGSPAPAGAVAMGDKAHGEKIFSQNCSGCHGAGGTGGGIGPSLKGEKARKDYPHTVTWVENPQPPMPKLYPSVLSLQDVADVSAYVQSL